MAVMAPESPFRPSYAVPPGATVSDLLEEHGMTQTQLARRLGVTLKHVNQVVNGSASISAELALGLEKVFRVPADFWLSREALYRSDMARQTEAKSLEAHIEWASRFPLKELKKRGLLPSDASGSDVVQALLSFLGIASPRQWEDPIVAYRKSQAYESDSYALATWLRVGELEAAEIDTAPYDQERFVEVLEEARHLTRLDPEKWQPKLVDACAAAGVAVVIIPAFDGARANGATRWLAPNKALIQLSIRYRWEDVFWFTFFHEAGHVVLHRKKDIFVEGLKATHDDPALTRLEDEANRFASRVLIPEEYERRLRQVGLADVEVLARELGIAPAIIVGRLQHDGRLPFNRGNELRRRFKFVE
jgi:HTH-type transcriptional regulator / antitoxin HigA